MLEEGNKTLLENKKNEQIKDQLKELTEQIHEKENEILRFQDKNSHLEIFIAEKNEEIKKLRLKNKEITSQLEENKNELFKLKNNQKIELEETKFKLFKENDEKIKRLQAEIKRLAKENDELKHTQPIPAQKDSKRMIPFLEEPYDADVELGPEAEKIQNVKNEQTENLLKQIEEKNTKISELEGENSELKVF